MKKWIFYLLLFVCTTTLSWGQILTFDFATIAGNENTINSNFNDSNLGISTISRGIGLTATTNSDRFNATNWATTSIDNAVSGNNYMEFTISPNSTFQFSVSSIVMQLQRSGAGLSKIALRSSIDGFASDLDSQKTIVDNTSTQSFTFTFTQSNSSSSVSYRLYGYAEVATGTGGPGDGTGNDIVVNGTVSTSASCTSPTTQATFSTSTPALNVITQNFAVGNGTGRLILINTTNSFTDPSDLTNPTANTIYGGSGQQVVFNGTSGSNVTVTNLSSNSTYYFAIYEYNCSGATTVYNATENTTSATTLSPTPEINIKQGVTNILTGGSHSFGNIEIGAFVDIVFTIDKSNI